MTVLIDFFQIFEDQFDRFDREFVGRLRRKQVGIGFHRVGQRIHARRACNMRRETDGELGVEYRIARNQAKILNGIFVMCRAVGHHGGDGGLGTGTRGGWHRKQRREFLEHAQRAAHLRHALVRFDHARASGFCAVHSGTATERDNAFAMVIDIELSRGFNILNRGIRFDAIVDDSLKARFVASRKKRIQQTKLSQHRIGHDQHTVDAFALDERRQFFNTARAAEQLRLTPGHEIHA